MDVFDNFFAESEERLASGATGALIESDRVILSQDSG
jgi:hypothetical protein